MTERSTSLRGTFMVVLGVLGIVGLALCYWQIERRAWKHDLIAAVNARSTAPPVPVAAPQDWPQIVEKTDAYRRVQVSGRFLHDKETLVRAVSDDGSGYWVMTPLDTGSFLILINRGFVPIARKDIETRAAGNPSGLVEVVGLLRMSEPDGGFLRANDPAANQYYSRDVGVMAKAKALSPVAPFFIDADATPNAGGYPKGGMTVIWFSDNHLVYAITWFALAMGCFFGVYLIRSRR